MENRETNIKEAIRVLKSGGIVIFPTDTAFGIGCRIDNEKAVKRLFKIRKRPLTQATPVLVDSVKMADSYVQDIPNSVREQLIDKYWPGALTIILLCKTDKIPKLVRGGGSTVGIRMPNHKTALSIIAGVGVPILGPSANFHGGKTPYRFEDLDKELIKLVDYVVPGECSVGNVSTVIDCSKKHWRIVREGAVSLNVILTPPLAGEESRRSFATLRMTLKTMNTLSIDTSSNKEIRVGLKMGKDKSLIKKKIDKQKTQVVLPMIDKLLKEHNLKPPDINAVKVNTGPGSFTGIRVGVAIANALSFALKIPRY